MVCNIWNEVLVVLLLLVVPGQCMANETGRICIRDRVSNAESFIFRVAESVDPIIQVRKIGRKR